ncbi:MAG TPA: helix-turn-helix transcriptional regulator [Caulobacter sp.]|nr:helix-turn-helix transcriptional regulator [Caulobacter sp.]
MPRTPSPHPIDVHVGNRLRVARTLRSLGQQTVGAAVGVTFQQIQKYEKGTNRISASTLHALARVLKVRIAWFFEGLPGQGPEGSDPEMAVREAAIQGLMATREGAELAVKLARLPPRQRAQVLGLIRAFAQNEPQGETA